MLKHMRNLLGGALLAIALGIPYLQAADVAISALPAGTTLTGTEAIPAVQSAATVKTTPAAIKTYVETGGTVTASDPVLDLTQTWNNSGVTFTGLKFNVTSTASAAASRIFDFQVDGSSKLYLDKTSGLVIPGVLGNSQTFGSSDGTWAYNSTTAAGFQWYNSGSRWFGISTPTTGTAFSSSTNIFEYRNGTNAQTLRVYNTYTDASNYERLAINAGAAGDWLQLAAETGGTGVDNIGLALTPAGTGAISAQVPDSTASGGNTRGTNAVDWSTIRTLSGQVASGAYSVVAGGSTNTASNTGDTVGGGGLNTASGGLSTIAGGESNTASGAYSWVPGGSQATTRGLWGAYAYSSGRRSANGDAQVIGQPVRRTTTDATPVSLATDGTPAATTIMIVPDGAVMMCTALVVAKPASAITDGVGFDIEGLVYRSGSTTALLSIPNSTVHGGNTLALAATFVANDTLEGLEIQVTGAAATTIYWVGELKCVQVL